MHQLVVDWILARARRVVSRDRDAPGSVEMGDIGPQNPRIAENKFSDGAAGVGEYDRSVAQGEAER
jgi:hypothetical protein